MTWPDLGQGLSIDWREERKATLAVIQERTRSRRGWQYRRSVFGASVETNACEDGVHVVVSEYSPLESE